MIDPPSLLNSDQACLALTEETHMNTQRKQRARNTFVRINLPFYFYFYGHLKNKAHPGGAGGEFGALSILCSGAISDTSGSSGAEAQCGIRDRIQDLAHVRHVLYFFSDLRLLHFSAF